MHIPSMAWEVEVPDEWLAWYEGLAEGDQDEMAAVIGLLEGCTTSIFEHSGRTS
jgi:hypothetical protein